MREISFIVVYYLLMKIKVISDLHLEFGEYNDIGNGDVLILAGDICIINDLIAEWMLHPHSDNTFLNFFDECVNNYNKVFYVMGNHEHYGWDYKLSEMWLRKCLPEGITLLNNEVVNYKGYNFIGSTLWTNYNNNEEDMYNCELIMSDYKQIKFGDDFITPEILKEENEKTMKFFSETIPNLENVIVITHHSPSQISVTDYHREMGIKFGYSNSLEDFIEDNNNIKYWFHGHIHESNDYFIGETNIISNPRGYVNHHENENLNKELEIVV